ncbi:hypothetical protein JYK00_07845 [Thermosipho ferrireducens]|uniref:Uncharacterized protein n=1 Tax=Thermosipho ferrireducens TaxID=2571116 RepID=A0ABX7S8Z9_9BACT|nr:hypothetical protein [Thermosipho ferrireducens]QTA37635.1 hypothetical protein JYK00_07845 [Thermosipho ferrireducens]
MKQKLIILIIVIGMVISLLLTYYLFWNKKETVILPVNISSKDFTYISKIKALESYNLNVESTNFFKPYLLNIKENNFEVNKIPAVPNIYFIGYYRFDTQNMVHLLSKGNFYTFKQEDLIFKRYHILKALSYGLIVLDVSEGDIKIIKIKQ